MELQITKDVEIVLSALTLIATTGLAFLVYLKDKKSATNRLFFILSMMIVLYIVVNYLSLHPPQGTPDNQLFWIRVVMAVTSLMGPILVLLVHTFPREKITLAKKYIIGLFSLMTLSVALSFGPFVFKAIEYPEGQPVPVPGPGIPVFFLDFIGLFIVSFIILVYKQRKALGEEKQKIRLFLFGVLATFSLMGISTVILVVLLKTSAGVFLGPIFPVILMEFIAYAIVKHRLFNVQVFSAQMFILVMSVVLFSKIFMSQSYAGTIIDAVTFVLVAVLGMLLVQSVKREIEQRERLSELASSLEEANLRLQELDQQKTEFLSIASHQLRTPLSIIKGYIELISDGIYGKIPKKAQDILHDMDESNERLVALVDEFLDITRIEQNRTKFNFASADITTTIESVVKELQQKADAKGLQIKVMSLQKTFLVMDEEKIRHVIFNYVDNAIKYSDKGTIKISFQSEDGGISLRVKDNGFGFQKEDEVNFFQKFYRGKNVEGTNVNGTGLGIYVCKKFIEAHCGKVWAKSGGLGKGSEFGFWIPLECKTKGEIEESASVSPHLLAQITAK